MARTLSALVRRQFISLLPLSGHQLSSRAVTVWTCSVMVCTTVRGIDMPLPKVYLPPLVSVLRLNWVKDGVPVSI